jgi:hypothetical protein
VLLDLSQPQPSLLPPLPEQVGMKKSPDERIIVNPHGRHRP